MLKQVLLVGTEEVLLQARATILRHRCAVSVASPNTALTRLRHKHFVVLIICSATPTDEAMDLIRRARAEFPDLYTVRLLSGLKPTLEERAAHETVVADLAPESWVLKVEPLLLVHAAES